MVATAGSPAPADEFLPGDDVIVMHDISWDVYEQLDKARGQSSVPRLTYLDGTLELMVPGEGHELNKCMLARLLEAYAEERDLFLNAYGSWTLKSKKLKRALEPDECYMVGPRSTREVPDLAIEIDWSRPGTMKLEVYRGLEVGEVWSWRNGKIVVRVLRDGAYVEVPRSALFPDLDLEHLLGFVRFDDQTAAVKAYRVALRGRVDVD
jgi:Uma2 family endonuclease